MFRIYLVTVLSCALLAGCAVTNSQSSDGISSIKSAVMLQERSEKDRERDQNRKPVEVLSFFGIKPGMQVLDMFSGGGYYSEIVSRVVGSEGKVHAHNNQAYLTYVNDEYKERYKDNRLPRVKPLHAENNELDLSPASYDAVLLILAYHDVYYVDEKNGWPKIDGPKLLAEIFSGLKPGGVLGVVDHTAEKGAPAEVGGTLHRIDPDRAMHDITAAGFVFEASSDVLANPDDELGKSMYDPELRGKTDRFVYRFRRP